MNATIPFTKMHGTGNSFVVLNGFSQRLPPDFSFADFAQKACARHFGIGADGLLLLELPDEDAQKNGAQIRMRMWNPDGSEDMCGNGLRCIARLAHESGAVAAASFVAQTRAGLRRCEIVGDSIRVEMGEPNFDFAAIPFAPSVETKSNIEYSISLGETVLPHVTTLSTGSAHTVVFVDELPDDATFLALSERIENHAWFPERASVMWAKVVDAANVQIRIWERGVQEANGTTGETLACGTGACAVAVAAQITNRCGDLVQIHSRGGALQIAWKNGEPIRMTGAARTVYKGVWNESVMEKR